MDPQHPAHDTDTELGPMRLHEGVLHFAFCAKYAAAFLRNTRGLWDGRQCVTLYFGAPLEV